MRLPALSRFSLYCSLPLICLVTSLSAQWAPERRLTYSGGVSLLSSNNSRCVDARGDTIHVVWHGKKGKIRRVYYKSSNTAGSTWSPNICLSNPQLSSFSPSISVSGASIHVVWCEEIDESKNKICYGNSTDGGRSWRKYIYLSNDSLVSPSPSVSSSGINIHVVWSHSRGPNNEDIYYKRSTDGGNSWNTEIRLTGDSAQASYPSVATSGSYIHVVWNGKIKGSNGEIFYKRSFDSGNSWNPDTQLTCKSAWSDYPSLSASGSSVHIVWSYHYERGRTPLICYMNSPDNGSSWGNKTDLVEVGGPLYPSISASDSYVHVVWQGGNMGIYYERSTDYGRTWEPSIPLTSSSDVSSPIISASGPIAHIIWEDGRHGDYVEEIYYRSTFSIVKRGKQ